MNKASATLKLSPTHYVLYNGHSHFVKEAEFFIRQGGLTEPWGKNWKPVVAGSIDDAREISKTLDWNN